MWCQHQFATAPIICAILWGVCMDDSDSVIILTTAESHSPAGVEVRGKFYSEYPFKCPSPPGNVAGRCQTGVLRSIVCLGPMLWHVVQHTYSYCGAECHSAMAEMPHGRLPASAKPTRRTRTTHRLIALDTDSFKTGSPAARSFSFDAIRAGR